MLEMKYDLVSEVDKGVVYLGNSQEILDDKETKKINKKDKKFDLTDKQFTNSIWLEKIMIWFIRYFYAQNTS